MCAQLTIDDYLNSNAWPFVEAKAVAKRYEKQAPEKGYVLFETGYGPSGLPHIGTFGEVFRTTVVRRAFERISDIPTKLVAFSDDMDGLRKVPDNIPNQEMVAEHLGKPLTQVPDPFGTHDSFGAHNNDRLKAFLDQFGFDYEFKSSTESYKAGEFDDALLAALRAYQPIMDIMLPTLGEERQASYSPFLPICPDTGVVLQVATFETHPESGEITYDHPIKGATRTKVTGGACKLQWKPDWAMRWAALEVDYEMHGKDLTPSVAVSSRMATILKKEMGKNPRPPQTYVYEMFLDEEGGKISKSKGNGISIEQWLTYGTPESLALYMFNNPKKAKRLYFDVIPQTVDEYLKHLAAAREQEGDKLLANPVWHIHGGDVPAEDVPVSFGLLLNLASAANTDEKSILWGFIQNYAPDTSPEANKLLDVLVGYALQYYADFVKPAKQYRAPTETEAKGLATLRDMVAALPDDADEAACMQAVYDSGKAVGFEPSTMRDWFAALYATLFGQSEGPRMGSFIKLYGRDNTVKLIDQALNGDLA